MKHIKGKSISKKEVEDIEKDDSGGKTRHGLDLFFKAFFEAGSQAMHILKNGAGQGPEHDRETADAPEPDNGNEQAREKEK